MLKRKDGGSLLSCEWACISCSHNIKNDCESGAEGSLVTQNESERPVAFENEGKGIGSWTVFTHWAFGGPAGLVCKLVSWWWVWEGSSGAEGLLTGNTSHIGLSCEGLSQLWVVCSWELFLWVDPSQVVVWWDVKPTLHLHSPDCSMPSEYSDGMSSIILTFPPYFLSILLYASYIFSVLLGLLVVLPGFVVLMADFLYVVLKLSNLGFCFEPLVGWKQVVWMIL